MCRTYDEYTSELASGHLSWTPVHSSDLFWKENAQKLNEQNYEQLKYALSYKPQRPLTSVSGRS
jgi:V-type H+-transporting ATPase subunit H